MDGSPDEQPHGAVVQQHVRAKEPRMPELPEVETVRAGLAPRIVNVRVKSVRVHDGRLRWPVPGQLPAILAGQKILDLQRRGKYLLFRIPGETLLVHLGMSGSLRLTAPGAPLRKHDHVEICLANGLVLRFHDPRRFGAVLLAGAEPLMHPLLASLGPEPLADDFDGGHLYRRSRKRRVAVKPFLMDAANVVGVGNIYASEALFLAGIRPAIASGRIGQARYDALATAVKSVLTSAIEQGGTTLRDFVDGSGEPGYFARHLAVYGRAGEPCRRCGSEIRMRRLGQRSTYWCPDCQK